MYRARVDGSNFARLATSAVNSSFFLLIFTSAPEKQNQKQRPQKKTETAKTPKEMDEHYFGPKPTGTQTRNQTKPTDRPTEPSTGPGPGADTKLYP